MIIKNYNDNYYNEWNHFVKYSRNGTFLNSMKFLKYHPPERFKDSSLLFFENQSLIGVIPATEIKKEKSKEFFSHPGSTYGGIIVNYRTTLKDVDQIVKNLLNYCKENKFTKIIIKTPPKIYHHYPSDEIDFILSKYGFNIKRDLTSSIFLPQFGKKRGCTYKKSCKRAIKTSKKEGLIVKESENFEEFWKILKKNLEVRYKTDPVHSLKEIKLLKALFPKKIRLLGAFFDEKIIAGVVLFIMPQTIHTQYIAMLYEYQKMRPVNAIFDYLINYGLKNGYLYINFGVSTENFGEKINWGLFKFKESFGGRGIIHESYEKIL